mgnify:CR=1 FL=1
MRTSATAGLAMTSAVYTFAQEAAARDMSVTVPVPPSTSKLDVAVTLRADRLRVSVVGHPRQPHVLDGELCYDVDPDCLSWALERAGGATGPSGAAPRPPEAAPPLPEGEHVELDDRCLEWMALNEPGTL